MVRWRPSGVVVVGATALAGLVLMTGSPGAGSLEKAAIRSAAPVKSPQQRIRLQSNRRPPAPLPVASYGMPVTYYSVQGDLETTLTLNNKGPETMAARVTLYARDGRRHSTDVSVPAHTFIELDLRPIAAAAGEGFEEGSLRISYTARIMEMGGMLRMTSLARGLEFDEQLMYPSQARSNQLEGVWWLPDAATDARLIVTNTTSEPVAAKVTFEGLPGRRTESVQLGPWAMQVLDFGTRRADGRHGSDGLTGGISIAYTGVPGGVSARGLIANDTLKYSAVVEFSDPVEAKTSTYHAGGVRVGDVGGSRLRPVIVARSVGRAALVTGRLRVTKADGETTAIELPPTLVTPGRVAAIEASGAWAEAREMSESEAVGIEFEHDAPPGTVQISVASVSERFDHVFRVPLTDPATLPSATGGYFWRLEDTRNTIVYLKNVTERPQRYRFVLRHAEGIWDPGPWVVPAGQNVTIDIADLRRTQATDARGNTLPLTVSAGQVHWSILGGQDYRGIVGRVEQVDVQHNVSSTYACPMPTSDNFYDAWITPYYELEVVGQWVKFTAWEQDADAYTHQPGFEYDISDILNWSSGHPSVASSGGNGWFLTQSGGSAIIHASGWSNGWEDYQGEGDPGNHVWISEDATLEVQAACAVPINFRRESVQHYGNGLEFHYRWDSSSGNGADLWHCQLRERVTFPGYSGFPTVYTFPSPPFTWNDSTMNPFISASIPGTDLEFFDQHTTGQPFVQPYSSVQVDASQVYEYRCSCSFPNDWVTIHQPFGGIRREFSPEGGLWKFELSKSGFVRTLFPLP